MFEGAITELQNGISEMISGGVTVGLAALGIFIIYFHILALKKFLRHGSGAESASTDKIVDGFTGEIISKREYTKRSMSYSGEKRNRYREDTNLNNGI